MATFEEFTKLAEDTAKQYVLVIEKLHDHILSLKIQGASTEICRLIFVESEKSIGVAFQIEVAPSDGIQIFSFLKHSCSEMNLLQCFYANGNEEVYVGIDAQVMLEQDRENKYLKILEERAKSQQEEDFHFKQLDKSGKITFH